MSDIMRHPSATMRTARTMGVTDRPNRHVHNFLSGEPTRAGQSEQACEAAGTDANNKGSNIRLEDEGLSFGSLGKPGDPQANTECSAPV